MGRVYMLAYILRKIVNPWSYLALLVFFSLIFISVSNVIPTSNWEGVIHTVAPIYTTLLVVRFLLCLIVFCLAANFVIRVICLGKFIAKISTLGLIVALCGTHIMIYFCMNAIPITISNNARNHVLFTLFEQTHMEVIATIVLGGLLALYVGVLARGKFQKNIGFIDDAVAD